MANFEDGIGGGSSWRFFFFFFFSVLHLTSSNFLNFFNYLFEGLMNEGKGSFLQLMLNVIFQNALISGCVQNDELKFQKSCLIKLPSGFG